MALRVKLGFLTSSVRYRSRREGMARNRRMIAGIMVQIVSICWASIKYRLVNLFVITEIRAYVTTVITKVRIIRVWSWKEIS